MIETQDRRDGLRYAIDTTDAEWAIIAPVLPGQCCRGRPRTTDLRAVVVKDGEARIGRPPEKVLELFDEA